MDNSNNIDDFEDFDDIEKRDFEKYQDEYGAEFDEEKGYVKDEADEWLEKAEGGNKDVLQEVEKLSIYGNSEDNNIEEGIKEYKGNEHNTSSLVLQLENFSKLEPRQVKFAYDLLTEPSLIGTKSKRLNSKSTKEVVKKFNSSIGGRLDEFTRELNSIVKKADRGATPGQEVRSTNVSYEQKMIFDMISLSVEKEEAGPGSRLLGYNLSSETDEKDKADLLWFNKRLTEIAHLYNRDSTKEQDPELYEKRISATEKELTKYLMVGHPGQVMKDYSTGLDLKTLDKTGMEVEWFESTSVPLPSDLDVRGLKTLQGRSMGAGSPHTRLSFAALFAHQDDLTLGGTVKFNEQAYLDSEASKFSEKELMQLAPSIKNTLFNPREVGRQNLIETRHDIDVDDWNKDYVFSVGRKVATEKFEELKTDMRKMSKIVRKLTVTVADEENGNNLRLLTGISEQNRARREAIDNAYIYDISHDKVKSEDILLDIDRNAEYRMGATNKGSDKGGMYNDEGMSYTDQFIELIESGVSAEEAATILNIDSTKKINRNVKEEDNIESDQERYLQRVGKGLEEGKYFKQGTEEWKEQRKGKITASVVSKLSKRDGVEKAAQSMFEEKAFVSNNYVSEGSRWEETVKKHFMEHTGYISEEAYFEENPDLPGFGVSPDGFVFDEYGKSKGLAEFKYHNSEKAMKGSLDKYYDQLQLQMEVTGQKNVHFFRMNQDTSNFMYENVEYDEGRIKNILPKGRSAIERLEELKMGRNLAIPDTAIEEAAIQNEQVLSEKQTTYKDKQEEVHEAQKKYVDTKDRNISNKDVDNTVNNEQKVVSERVRMAHETTKMINNLKEEEFKKEEKQSKNKEKEEKKSREDLQKKEKENLDARAEYDRDEYFARQENNKRDIEAKLLATEEHSAKMREYAESFKKAASSVLGMSKSGADSMMETVKAAKRTGIGVERMNGMVEMATIEGGLTRQESFNLVTGAADLRREALSGGKGLSSFMGKQMEAQAIASRAGFDYEPLQMDQLENINPAEMVALLTDKIGQVDDPATSAALWDAYGLPQGATISGEVTGDMFRGASISLPEVGARNAHRGLNKANFLQRTIDEKTARNLGDTGNVLLSTFDKVTSDPLGYVGAAVVDGVSGVAEVTGSILPSFPERSEVRRGLIGAMDRERELEATYDVNELGTKIKKDSKAINNINVKIDIDKDSVKAEATDEDGVSEIALEKLGDAK